MFWLLILLVPQIVTGRTVQDDVVNVSVENNDVARILEEIRALMKNADVVGSEINAYIIESNDAHNSEYVSDRDKRIQYITKFTGSTGTAIIMTTRAAFWTDSRYYTQAENQIDGRYWTVLKLSKNNSSPLAWLIDNLPVESRVGVDPFLTSSKKFEDWSNLLNRSGHSLVSIRQNLVDLVWPDRPEMSKNKIEVFPLKFSGRSASEKIDDLRQDLEDNNAIAAVLTALDDIAWLLNLRGSDIQYNPVFFSYVIYTQDKIFLYVPQFKITSRVRRHLDAEGVDYVIQDYNDILIGIEQVLCNTTENEKILLPIYVNQAILEMIPKNRRVTSWAGVARIKTVKNEIESNGLREAHIRDGAALITYLHWLDTNLDRMEITELSGAAKLAEFRSRQKNFKGLSFESISAIGSNGAMVHYSPTEETDRQITRDELYLIDSGGQYWDGTTDVTRTVHFGTPTEEERECFTRVLKGFIGFVTSVFPKTANLYYFDLIARRSLWQVGLNYGHGSGHGVGAFLYVHEYPPLIGDTATGHMMEHMFTSNEPGYYKDGEFGIRLEDVIEAIKHEGLRDAFDGAGALTFETVTFAPIQTKMIVRDLLTKDEVEYINNYHRKVLEKVGPLLLEQNLNETFTWLVNELNPIDLHEMCSK